MDADLWQGVLYLHLLAMAFFVGGQLLIAVVVVPVEGGDEDRTRMRAIGRRFGWGSLVALAVLLATGASMASHYELWSDPTLQAKLGLFVLVGVLIAAHLRWPRVHALQAVITVVSLAIVWLGLDLAG
jgi:uncharacterized membrane protein